MPVCEFFGNAETLSRRRVLTTCDWLHFTGSCKVLGFVCPGCGFTVQARLISNTETYFNYTVALKWRDNMTTKHLFVFVLRRARRVIQNHLDIELRRNFQENSVSQVQLDWYEFLLINNYSPKWRWLAVDIIIIIIIIVVVSIITLVVFIVIIIIIVVVLPPHHHHRRHHYHPHALLIVVIIILLLRLLQSRSFY